MTDISNASRGVKLALIEGQLLSRQIDRHVFLEGATRLGLSGPDADAAAGKLLAIAANQVGRGADLKSSYDYIVIGSGASGAVVARRLAENRETTVLLLEAGGEDLKPSVLMTETWVFNQGTDVDWAFQAEPSKSVNNRSIKQAMGRVFGGSTSINGMVWARGHKNDFDDWAKEAGATRPGVTGMCSMSTSALRTGRAYRTQSAAAVVAMSTCSLRPIPIR
jgi:choline dehydrogenase